MKVYLTCYVWGDGYTTKCFDTVKQEVMVGSHTMNDQERTLFVRSNARLLLASVGMGRFGFVRQIEAGTTDENGRKCVINLALAGNGVEVDGVIAMAAGHYPEFAQAVRGMVYYEGTEFKLDWEKFQALAGRAGQKGRNRNPAKPVTLLCAEPSIGYFIKNCGMGWKESDIEVRLDLGVFSERGRMKERGSVPGGLSGEGGGSGNDMKSKGLSGEGRESVGGLVSKGVSGGDSGPGEGVLSKGASGKDVGSGSDISARLPEEKVSGTFQERDLEMRLYIYCATPSMGYVLREIDSRTGDVLHEEKEARKMIPGELLAMIDNAGCKMALFHVGNRECFVAKEVKADGVNQYGQRTTVCLAIESTKDERTVRQMGVRALFDYDAFRIKLTDCVKVSAGTVGYMVDGEKLQRFIRFIQEPMCFAPADPCHVQWDILMKENSRKYTFLVMDTSLDYFCRSTGLEVSRQQVFYICPENVLGGTSGELAAAFRAGSAKIGVETSKAGSTGTKATGVKSVIAKEFHTGMESEPIEKTPSDQNVKTAMEDAIDLLKNPVFRAALGVFAFVLLVLLLGIMIYKLLRK